MDEVARGRCGLFSGLVLITLLACESSRPPAESAASAATGRAAPPVASVAAPVAAPAVAEPSVAGPFAHLYIDDMDWRSGGFGLFLRGDGSGVLRVAGPLKDNVQNEKRYELGASAERAKKFHSILEAHGARTMKVDRMHAPGDDLAIVRILPNAGSEISLEGASGRNEAYRKLLLELESANKAISLDGLRPVYEGKLDAYWTPPFASPGAIVSRYSLGRMKDGKLQPVATLVFDRRACATLTIDVPGDDADSVKRAWTEVSSTAELSVKTETEAGGEHRLVGKTVRRGDASYPAAAIDALGARYGVFAVEQKR